MRELPNWLRLWFQDALITEIYSNIRAVAVGFSDKRELTVIYYLDREPTDYDYDSLRMVIGEIEAKTSSASQIVSVEEQCIFSTKKQSDIDSLDGLVYARREYDIEVNLT